MHTVYWHQLMMLSARHGVSAGQYESIETRPAAHNVETPIERSLGYATRLLLFLTWVIGQGHRTTPS